MGNAFEFTNAYMRQELKLYKHGTLNAGFSTLQHLLNKYMKTVRLLKAPFKRTFRFCAINVHVVSKRRERVFFSQNEVLLVQRDYSAFLYIFYIIEAALQYNTTQYNKFYHLLFTGTTSCSVWECKEKELRVYVKAKCSRKNLGRNGWLMFVAKEKVKSLI